MIVTDTFLTEYHAVLLRPRIIEKYGLTQEDIADFLLVVDAHSSKATPAPRLPVTVRDRKDERVLAAALGGGATYLVTGDDDLLVLRDDECLGDLQKIVTAREFLCILSKADKTE